MKYAKVYAEDVNVGDALPDLTADQIRMKILPGLQFDALGFRHPHLGAA